jgi:hypothetical protein
MSAVSGPLSEPWDQLVKHRSEQWEAGADDADVGLDTGPLESVHARVCRIVTGSTSPKCGHSNDGDNANTEIMLADSSCSCSKANLQSSEQEDSHQHHLLSSRDLHKAVNKRDRQSEDNDIGGDVESSV